MQSVRMNRPRAPSHISVRIIASTTKAPTMISTITHHSMCSADPNWRNESAIAFPLSRLLHREEGLNEALNPPESLARNAAKPITSHFFKSNGWNKIFFINSKASPNGLKISIFESDPFMHAIVNGFLGCNQACLRCGVQCYGWLHQCSQSAASSTRTARVPRLFSDRGARSSVRMWNVKRRYPIGAELINDHQTHFRVWAPKARVVDVVLESGANSKQTFHSLAPESAGYFSGTADAAVGSRYWFRINEEESFYPDPASRFQPEGPHGPSCIVNPAQFQWSDSQWQGVTMKGQIAYEMHIGTFTKQGTWRAAAEQLPELARIGFTVIEMMPIADFPGSFGWGYDGVNLFAPTRLYGTPDEFRQFVDTAHSLGMAVLLDVVYNHFGPDGNYLGKFSADYVSHEGDKEWGDAINFDGPNS